MDCRRCHLDIEHASDADVEHVYEGMHYVCFHYEFEHHSPSTDPDIPCDAGGCPANCLPSNLKGQTQ